MANQLKNKPRRRIAVATGTRAEWGLLSGIVRALDARPDTEVSIIATNMHLDHRYGHTIDEIIADGFTVAERVAMTPEGDSPADRVRAMGRCLEGMAGALERLRPDLLVILGDRYEMLAVASAALVMLIPVVHIAGGEISEGAVDDSIRHAITKMASLHLTATEPYRRRVIQMGEEPDRVINTGAIGVYNIANEPVMSRQELEDSLGFSLEGPLAIVTYHPATLDGGDPAERFEALTRALDAFPALRLIITYPNNDANGAEIIGLINRYAEANPGRVLAIPSLGKRRYLSALHYASAVIGNSSSGIVEVPSMHIPTVDIGIRQRGRLCSDSVIHCGDSTPEITEAIARALSPEGQATARNAANPYHRSDTLATIVSAIAETPLEALRHKHFHDLPTKPEE